MKLAQTSCKSAVLGRRHRRLGAALLAGLFIASCGGRAKDQRESDDPSPGVGGADNVASAGGASSGGTSSGGQAATGGTTGDGGTSSQGSGGSFGGAFESEDFEGSCRYVECEGCFRCVELYFDSGCGIPDVQPGHSMERSDQSCPREGLVAVCLEDDRIRYFYENSDIPQEYLETYCVLVED